MAAIIEIATNDFRYIPVEPVIDFLVGTGSHGINNRNNKYTADNPVGRNIIPKMK